MKKLTAFVQEHIGDDLTRLILDRKKWPDIDMDLAVSCIQSRRKLKGKVQAEKLLEIMDKQDKSEEVLDRIIAERKERCSIILYAEGSNKLIIDNSSPLNIHN